MAPARLLHVLALFLLIQVCLGQHFYMGSIEAKKLPTATKKDIESVTLPKNIENMAQIQKARVNENVRPDLSFNFNKSDTKPGDDSRAKHSRNQGHASSGPSLKVINRNGQSLYSRPTGLPTISQSAPNADPPGAAAGPTTGDPAGGDALPASAAPPAPTLASPSSLYLTNAQPTLSSLQFLPNVVSLQAIAAHPQKQAPLQTLSPFLTPTSNTQTQVKYLQVMPVDAAQKTMDNNILVNNQYVSPNVISRLLTQSLKAQSIPSDPIQNTQPSRDTKQLNDKTILMLLLKFINERNSKKKYLASQKPNMYGFQRKDGAEVMSQENSSESDSNEHVDVESGPRRRAGPAAAPRAVCQDYDSDQSEDYSGENYSDDCL